MGEKIQFKAQLVLGGKCWFKQQSIRQSLWTFPRRSAYGRGRAECGGRRWIRWSTRALTVPHGHSALLEEPLWNVPVLLKYQHKLSHQRKRVKFKCDQIISLSVLSQKENPRLLSRCLVRDSPRTPEWGKSPNGGMCWDAYPRSLLFPRLNFSQQLWVCPQGNAPSAADWSVSSLTSQKEEGE